MANDAFMTPEIPQPVRDLMKLSIEQARRAFETFAAISEKTWKSLENSSPLGRAGLFALNVKIAEIMRANADANFALAVQQMETFAQQLEEMRDLAAQIVQEANSAARGPSASSHGRNSPGYASYAPSSSVTPGEGY